MTSIAENTPTSPANDATPLDVPSSLDLLLRGQRELDRILEDHRAHGAVIRKLLLFSVLGLAAHGFVVGLSAQLFDLSVPAFRALTSGPAAAWMPVAFVTAFLGALSICLPSFYFYTQLAGLDASFRLVTVQALRVQATTAVFLVGALPIYLAVALTGAVTDAIAPEVVVFIGMAMPFLIGLAGLRALFLGFRHMLSYVEITHQRRGRFLLRLLGLWAAVYTFIAPVALFRATQQLAALF